jgi:hypothetical protein
MRSILNLAVESAHLPVGGMYTLSMEEEELLVMEAPVDLAAADAAAKEAGQALEIGEAFEDLAEVMGNGSDEVTPREAELIGVATQMAVAGTEVEPESTIPVQEVATESARGSRIAMEAATDTARRIWNTILEYLKKIWKYISDFFYKVVGNVPVMRRQIEGLKTKAEACRKMELNKEKSDFKIASPAGLAEDGKVVKNATELKAALSTLEGAASFAFTTYAPAVVSVGEGLAKIIGEVKPDNTAAKCVEVKDLLKSKFSALKVPGASADTRYSGYNCQIGHPLLGGVSLLTKQFSDSVSEQGHLGSLERWRKAGLELVPTKRTGGEVTGEHKFAAMSPSEMEAVLGNIEKILRLVEDFGRGKKFGDLKKASETLKTASGKAASECDKLQNSEKDDEKLKGREFKAILSFNTAFASWTKDPAGQLMGHLLRSGKSAIVMVERSIACYK